MTYILVTVVIVLLVARFAYVLGKERRDKQENLRQVFPPPPASSFGGTYFGAAAPKLQQAPVPVSIRRLRNQNIRLVWSNPHLYEGPTRKSKAPLRVVK